MDSLVGIGAFGTVLKDDPRFGIDPDFVLFGGFLDVERITQTAPALLVLELTVGDLAGLCFQRDSPCIGERDFRVPRVLLACKSNSGPSQRQREHGGGGKDIKESKHPEVSVGFAPRGREANVPMVSWEQIPRLFFANPRLPLLAPV